MVVLVDALDLGTWTRRGEPCGRFWKVGAWMYDELAGCPSFLGVEGHVPPFWNLLFLDIGGGPVRGSQCQGWLWGAVSPSTKGGPTSG